MQLQLYQEVLQARDQAENEAAVADMGVEAIAKVSYPVDGLCVPCVSYFLSEPCLPDCVVCCARNPKSFVKKHVRVPVGK